MTTLARPSTTTRRAELDELTAGDVMSADVATIVSTEAVSKAMTMMRGLGVRHLPVLGENRFVGLVDDRLVAFALLAGGGFGAALEQPVSAVMTTYVPQVGPGDSLQRVAHLLRTSRSDAVVVVDSGEQLLGIITTVDVVSAVAFGLQGSEAGTTTRPAIVLPAPPATSASRA